MVDYSWTVLCAVLVDVYGYGVVYCESTKNHVYVFPLWPCMRERERGLGGLSGQCGGFAMFD